MFWDNPETWHFYLPDFYILAFWILFLRVLTKKGRKSTCWGISSSNGSIFVYTTPV